MKKLLSLALLGASSVAMAGFTPGNIIVTIIGDGVNQDAGAQMPVILREYTTAGVQVGADIPLTFAGINDNQLTLTLGETSEGGLSLSEDGRFLAVSGIYSIPGTLGEAFSANRVIVKIDANGNIHQSAIINYSTLGGDSARSVHSVDGNYYWQSSGSGGIDYVNFADGTGQEVVGDGSSGRAIGYDGTNLFYGSSDDNIFQGNPVSNSLYSLVGKPTSATTATLTLGFGPSPRGMFFKDANTLFLGHSSSSAGIIRYNKVGNAWVNAGSSAAVTTGVNYLQPLGGSIYATKDGGSKILKVSEDLTTSETIVEMTAGYVVRGISVVPPVSRTISGTIELQNFASDDGRALVAEVWSGNTLLETTTTMVQPGGILTFPTAVAPGSYSVRVKASHWLGQTIPVTLTTTGASGLSYDLINGDVDGDDVVSVFDYIRLSDAFDSAPGDLTWDAEADLDGDLVVSVFDYIVLSDNFDKAGN